MSNFLALRPKRVSPAEQVRTLFRRGGWRHWRGILQPQPQSDWLRHLRDLEVPPRESTPRASVPVAVVSQSAWAADSETYFAPRKVAETVTRCRVAEFLGEQAAVTVEMDGYEVQRVAFPAWILHRKKLKVGNRFHWIMRNGGRVRLADIDADVPQVDELTPTQKAELERLYAEMEHDLAEGKGKWPIHTGAGD